MRRFDLLVFDWDGTLMDSEARIVNCLQTVIDELALPLRGREELRNIIGLGMREAVLTLYPDGDMQFVDRFIDCYRHHYLSAEQTPTPLFAGAFATLQALHAKDYLLAVATGKSRRGLDRSLHDTQSGEFFHCTRCADETLSKPHPQMLLEIMAVLDVTADRTLMIGDTEYDLLMANQAGTAAAAVDYGAHERERLLAHAPLVCLDNISALVGWLEQC